MSSPEITPESEDAYTYGSEVESQLLCAVEKTVERYLRLVPPELQQNVEDYLRDNLRYNTVAPIDWNDVEGRMEWSEVRDELTRIQDQGNPQWARSLEAFVQIKAKETPEDV